MYIYMYIYIYNTADLYQPKGRYEHSTETIGENVYMWGGCCAFTAIENNVIDVFNLRTGELFIVDCLYLKYYLYTK